MESSCPSDLVVEIPKGVVLMDSGEIKPVPALRIPANVLKAFYEGNVLKLFLLHKCGYIFV